MYNCTNDVKTYVELKTALSLNFSPNLMNGVVDTEEQHLPHPVRGLEPLGGARVVEVPEPARRVAHVRRLQRHQRQVQEQRLALVVLPDNLPRLLHIPCSTGHHLGQ